MPNDNTNTGAGSQAAGAADQGAEGQGQQPQTSDGTGQNTGAGQQQPGAGTQTSQQPTGEQTKEKTFTQADVDRIVSERIKKGVKAELKKIIGEGEPAKIEDVQRQLSESQAELRTFRARDEIHDFIADPANKLAVRPENFRAIEKLVLADLEFDEAGKPSNLAATVEAVKKLAPALFSNSPGSINAGEGKGSPVSGFDMNSMIRRAAGRQ